MGNQTPSPSSSTSDIRRLLADGDVVTITVKLPKNLREAARREAKLRGTTLSSMIRELLILDLSQKRAE